MLFLLGLKQNYSRRTVDLCTTVLLAGDFTKAAIGVITYLYLIERTITS